MSTSVENISDAQFVLEKDESRLWARADRVDQQLQESRHLHEDKALEAFLNGIGREILDELGAENVPIRVYVLLDPYLNAFAMPNGSIYLHSGLVARAKNRSQLATILGHELSHYTRRHSLKAYRTAKNKHTVAALFGGTSLESNSFSHHLRNVQQSGFARDLEREADLDALESIRSSRYDLHEAPRIFEELLEESKETDQPYYLGSHPRLSERLDFARGYLRDHRVEESRSSDEARSSNVAYDDQIAQLLFKNAVLSFETGLTAKARRNVDRYVRVRPDEIDGYLLLSRIHRSRMSKPTHREGAISAFRQILRIDPENSNAMRELGLMLRGSLDQKGSAQWLERYLAMNPEAADRGIIEAYLAEMSDITGVAP